MKPLDVLGCTHTSLINLISSTMLVVFSFLHWGLGYKAGFLVGSEEVVVLVPRPISLGNFCEI